MASFRSSFDPCKRSATAAAATAPAASGMVCGNVNNSQEEKYKLHSEIFLKPHQEPFDQFNLRVMWIYILILSL
jgi:hypothetical protein